MNNQRPLGPKDQTAEQDYDTSFIGVNELVPAMQLPPGYVASAKNCRFRKGKAETRPGLQICPWMKGDGRTPWTEVYGGMVFGDPNAKQSIYWFLIAADGGIWRTRPSMTAVPVKLPPGVVLDKNSFTQLVQCFNVIILLRGPNFAPLVCQDLDQGFGPIVITPTQVAAGLSAMPNASYGVFYSNRLLLIQGKDLLAVSDIQTYTAYIPVTETFRINEGAEDALTAIGVFGPGQLVPLKEQSVFTISGATGDLTAAVQSELTREYGCVAPFSAIVRGTNLYWMSGEGITSLNLTELNQTQTTDQRLSDPIPITIGRINQQYISGCVAEVWDSKLYMAVPLDDATVAEPDIMPAGNYAFFPPTTINLVVGKQYKLTTSNDVNFIQLRMGTQLLGGDIVFTATAPTAIVQGNPGNPIVASLNPLLTGVNTGVLVYDFINGAWCGSDEGPAVAVKAFLKATYRGVKRLFVLGADGIIRLYEEGFEDEMLEQVASPHFDLLVTSSPLPVGSIQVNGGDVVTAINSAANAGTEWGANTVANAMANLLAGYEGGWSTPGVTVSAIDGGVRFTGPTINVVIHGEWAFTDPHTGVEVTSVDIQCVGQTRGYVTRSYVFANEDKKRFLMLAAFMATWDPSYTLGTIVNGVNQTTTYADTVTRDNTAYDVQGEAPWQPDNANDDHGTPKREDYSVVLPDLGFSLGASGVVFDFIQNATDRLPIDEKGHWVQMSWANTTGRFELWSVFMEAQEGDKLSGPTF